MAPLPIAATPKASPNGAASANTAVNVISKAADLNAASTNLEPNAIPSKNYKGEFGIKWARLIQCGSHNACSKQIRQPGGNTMQQTTLQAPHRQVRQQQDQ
jgi:hypothetical protein